MDIFGIGPLELLLIFVLAMIFIGPGKMPELAASLGKMLREFRAASAELTDALNAEIADAERRKTAVAAGENGNGHSLADAAQAEIVAQGETETPAAIEFTSPEVIDYNYVPSTPAPPAPVTTIDDVLGAIAQQEADEAAKREAEEAARLAAIALERAIRNGVGPLPESLLLASTDSPLVVVNPTEQPTPEPAAAVAAESTESGAPVDAPVDSPVEKPIEEQVESQLEAPIQAFGDARLPSPNGQSHDAAPVPEPEALNEKAADVEAADVEDVETESLEISGASQAEVR